MVIATEHLDVHHLALLAVRQAQARVLDLARFLAEDRSQLDQLPLAEAKALAVSMGEPGQLVLGGDSLVEVSGRLFDKPVTRADAAAHLAFFSGQTMRLHSAAVLIRDGVTIWRHVETVKLKVRTLSQDFIQSYLDSEWPAVAACVGVFRIEAMGVQLFENIEGSHFTVLGMPLLPLLAALRTHAKLPA